MKAVISNRIYLDDVSPELQRALVKKLTYRLQPKVPLYRPAAGSALGLQPEVVRNYSLIRTGLMSIPVGRTDLVPPGYEIVDRRAAPKVDFPAPSSNIELRESQKAVYDEVSDNCIINAPVSWGKTFTALLIASKLGLKTLVVVHTVALRDQWIEEARNLLQIEPSVIKGGSHTWDSPITIANIQSLVSAIKKNPDLRNEFGLVILDEAHHVPATTFKTAVDFFNSRYKIGLTGTLERKDGKHIMFSDYFSDRVFKPVAENFMTPSVLLVESNIKIPSLASCGHSWANVVTKLANTHEYRYLLVLLAKSMAESGHQVLAVSDRLDLLDYCHGMTPESSVLVNSKVKNRDEIHEQLITREKDILWGSVNIYSEGISLNSLSCLLLGIQTNNRSMLRQLIGRVTRKFDEHKKDPVIVDILLKGQTAKSQAAERIGLYGEHGYKINKVTM